MATRQDLGDLFVSLKLDQSGLAKGFSSAAGNLREELAGLGKSLAGAFTLGALVERGGEAMRMADDLQDAAEAADTTTGRLQAMQTAAKDAGAGVEKMTQALFKVKQARTSVVTGAEDADKMRAAFERLGVSGEDLARLDPAELLARIGAGLANGGNDGQSFSDVLTLIGEKAGPAMVAALRDIGSQGLDPMIAKLTDAGRIMDDVLVNQLAEANKRLERYDQSMTILAGKTIGWIQDLGEFYGAMWYGDMTADQAGRFVADNKQQDQLAQAQKEQAAAESRRREALDGMTSRTMANEQKLADMRVEKAEQYRRLMEQINVLEVQRGATASEFDQAQMAEQISQLRLKAEPLRKELEQQRQQDDDKRDQKDRQRILKAAQLQRSLEIQLADAVAGKGTQVKPVAPADSLARIGGFVGSRTDPMMRAVDRQLQVMLNIERIVLDGVRTVQSQAATGAGGLE